MSTLPITAETNRRAMRRRGTPTQVEQPAQFVSGEAGDDLRARARAAQAADPLWGRVVTYQEQDRS
jgi:hypothetical protein